MPKVTIIVPVYNVEQYLNKCLDSIQKQTLDDIEVIIVNDGTKDNSEEIIDKYVARNKNFIKINKENGGLSSARNLGISNAKGDYIAFIDSDDYIDCNMINKMYEKAIKEKLNLVVCDCYKVNGDKLQILKSNLNYSTDIVKNYIISYPMACTRLYKKELFTPEYMFKEKIYYEDLYLTPTLVIETKKIGFIEEPLYYYVQRDSSIMNSKFTTKFLDIFKVLAHVKDSFIDNNMFSEYQEEIEYLYITHLLRSTTLRFLDYSDSSKYLNNINSIMKSNFPNWKNNKYLKKSSLKLKIICKLAYKGKYELLRIIKKIK